MNIFKAYFEYYKSCFSVFPLDEVVVLNGLLTFFFLVSLFGVMLFPKMTYRKMSVWLRRLAAPWILVQIAALPSLIGIPVCALFVFIDSLEYKKSVIPTIRSYAEQGVFCPHRTYKKQVKEWKFVPREEREKRVSEYLDGLENDYSQRERILTVAISFIIGKLFLLAFGIIF